MSKLLFLSYIFLGLFFSQYGMSEDTISKYHEISKISCDVFLKSSSVLSPYGNYRIVDAELDETRIEKGMINLARVPIKINSIDSVNVHYKILAGFKSEIMATPKIYISDTDFIKKYGKKFCLGCYFDFQMICNRTVDSTVTNNKSSVDCSFRIFLFVLDILPSLENNQRYVKLKQLMKRYNSKVKEQIKPVLPGFGRIVKAVGKYSINTDYKIPQKSFSISQVNGYKFKAVIDLKFKQGVELPKDKQITLAGYEHIGILGSPVPAEKIHKFLNKKESASTLEFDRDVVCDFGFHVRNSFVVTDSLQIKINKLGIQK